MKGITISLPELLALGHPRRMMRSNPTQAKNQRIGQHSSRNQGRGMEFDQVRRYESGDDIRAIDWRVTARTNKPHTKLFHEEKEQPTYILVDQSASLFFGSQHELKSVTAARAAAYFAWQSFHRHDRLGGIIIGTETSHTIKPQSGKSGLHTFLHQLVNHNHALYGAMKKSEVQINQRLPLEKCLLNLTHLAQSGAQIIIISDFYNYDNSIEKLIARLSRHNQLTGVYIYDPLEEELPRNGVYTVSDGLERFNINTAPVQLRNQFRENFCQKKQILQTYFQQCGAQWQSLGTHENLVTQL